MSSEDNIDFIKIKDFRGFLAAGFWQVTARLFGHNLKSSYNPKKGEDKMIEHIIDTIIKL